MRVLAITSLYPSPWQPLAGVFNARQLAALDDTVDIEAICPVFWTVRLSSRRAPYPKCLAEERLHRPLYVFPPGMARGWHGLFYWACIRGATRRLVRSWTPDLVYGMFAYPDGWAAARLARSLRVPFVLKVHGTDVHALSKDPCRRPGLVESLGSARRIVCVSEDLSAKVRDLLPSAPVCLVRNGVDFDVFRPGPAPQARLRLGWPPGGRIVLFAGRLERIKGADLLPAVAKALGGSVRFAVAGDGSLRRSLDAALGSGALFLGNVPQDTLADVYRACDAVVVPSRSEGVPNCLLEALACDRPVVASRVGGIPEVLREGEGGCLVEPEDVEGFARGLLKVLEAPPVPGSALRLVSGFTWRASAEALCDVFSEALG